MATEFFRAHGISERKKLIFKEREMQNIKILITQLHTVVTILPK